MKKGQDKGERKVEDEKTVVATNVTADEIILGSRDGRQQ